jgi:hypothetical protein
MAALIKLEHNPAEEAQIEAAATTSTTTMSRKSPSFYLAVFGISMVALITAWDATSLAGALPVSREPSWPGDIPFSLLSLSSSFLLLLTLNG